MLKKLRIKFVCVNMLLVTVMLTVILALVFRSTVRSLESASVQMLRAQAADPLPPGRPGEPPQGMRLPFFTIQAGPRGDLEASGGGYYDLSDEALLRELADAAWSAGEQIGVLRDYGLRFCLAPGGRRIVFADISGERAALGSLARSCLAAGCTAFLGFLGVSLLLARWAVGPVEAAWTRQRQFVADASHELKTPLTVILTNAELLGDPAWGPADRERFSRNILTMARQMRGLVESLLELARLDAGGLDAAPKLLDLSALVSDAVLPFEPVYFERGLELACRIEAGVRVRGSEARLRQLADILLDNAAKYAAPHSQVTVTLARRGGRSLLSVSSAGAPIPAEELESIFLRFYRADKARRRDGSFGLGLSIAREIVQAHRGRIWAESGDGRNVFHAELPAPR